MKSQMKYNNSMLFIIKDLKRKMSTKLGYTRRQKNRQQRKYIAM